MTAADAHASPPWRGYLVAARLQYYGGAVVLYAVGTLLATGTLSPPRFALGLVVVSLVHLITHYVNDAEDVATDDATANPTFATGGSRAIQRGLVTPQQLLRASAIMAALVLLACGVLAATGHYAEAMTDFAMLTLGYAYSGRPFMLGRRLLGEVDAALVMGLLLPLAGSYAAGGPSPLLAPLAAIFVAQTFLGRLATAYPDRVADRATQKWTITAVLGTRGSAIAFVAIGLVLAGLAELATTALPSPMTMRVSVWVTAAAAFVTAALILGGRLRESTEVRVPMLAVGAFGISLTAITAALWMPWLRLP